MIYQLFVTLLISAFTFLFYGWYVKNDLFRIIGATLLLLLGVAVMPSSFLFGASNYLGNVQFMSGANITDIGGSTIITNIYTTFSNHTLGYYLMLTGILALIIIMVERRYQ